VGPDTQREHGSHLALEAGCNRDPGPALGAERCRAASSARPIAHASWEMMARRFGPPQAQAVDGRGPTARHPSILHRPGHSKRVWGAVRPTLAESGPAGRAARAGCCVAQGMRAEYVAPSAPTIRSRRRSIASRIGSRPTPSACGCSPQRGIFVASPPTKANLHGAHRRRAVGVRFSVPARRPSARSRQPWFVSRDQGREAAPREVSSWSRARATGGKAFDVLTRGLAAIRSYDIVLDRHRRAHRRGPRPARVRPPRRAGLWWS